LKDGAAQVTAFDDLSTGSKNNITDSRIRFVLHDICNPITVDGPVDYIFNLASPASPFDYDRLWLETMRTGSLGTQNALDLARTKKAVLLHASTSEIYGDPTVSPQTESYLGNVNSIGPRAVYDEAKRYGEALVTAYRDRLGVKTRMVRIFNTYGPRMRLDDGRVVPAFVAQALKGEDFTVFGDGTQTRSFCYVDDEIDGIVRLMLSDFADPVNIGNPIEMTMLQFAEAVRTAAGGGGKISFKPLPKDDPKQRKPDISRAKSVLGWEPRVSLADGLAKTIAYFRGML
jgi:dTDP-glucose 4,6-dehydratase